MREWLHSIMLRIRATADRRRLERDLEDEIAFHLAMKAERARDDGGSDTRAHQAALRAFGNPTLTKETLRETWTFTKLESVWQDIRHTARALARTPVFSAVAIASLAIGIGANTSIFTVFNTLFLESLPVREPQDLRVVNWTGRDQGLVQWSSGYGSGNAGVSTRSSFSFEAFDEIRKNRGVFSSVAGFARFSANVLARSQAHIAPAQLVSGRYFETLGTKPACSNAHWSTLAG